MHFVVYFFIAIQLICIQTTLLPVFHNLFAQYDLLISFVAYLTLFRSSIGMLPVIIVAGCLMDLLSGGFPGIYVITYLIILILFRNSTGYFHFRNSVLFQIVVILAVLMENIIFGIIIAIQSMRLEFSFNTGGVFVLQLIWAGVSSPLLFYIFEHIFHEIDKRITGGLRERV